MNIEENSFFQDLPTIRDVDYDKCTETIRKKTRRNDNEKSLMERQEKYRRTTEPGVEDESDLEDKMLAATSARGMIVGSIMT